MKSDLTFYGYFLSALQSQKDSLCVRKGWLGNYLVYYKSIFFFKFFKMLLHCLSTCIVSQKSVLCLLMLCYSQCVFFFPWMLLRLSLYSWFWAIWFWYVFMLFLHGVFVDLEFVCFQFSSNLQNSQHCLSKVFFISTLLFLCQGFQLHRCKLSWSCSTVHWWAGHFSSDSLFSQFGWFLLLCLQDH